jgi:hypothetical protein
MASSPLSIGTAIAAGLWRIRSATLAPWASVEPGINSTNTSPPWHAARSKIRQFHLIARLTIFKALSPAAWP